MQEYGRLYAVGESRGVAVENRAEVVEIRPDCAGSGKVAGKGRDGGQ